MNDGVSTTKNTKWITGVSSYIVSGDDDVLNVDTSSNAVLIILPNIKNAGLDLFPKKIFINDASNNAATNNITIASVGCNVNGAASTTIDTNNGTAECETSGSADWLINKSTDGSGGASLTPTSILWNDLLALYNSNAMAAGFYNITDMADNGIIIQAISQSKLTLNATGLFLNADYQGVGDYSSIPLFTGNNGVWYSTMLSPIANKTVVIWSGYHYKSLTGAVGAQPDTDSVNWLLLPKSQANVGYIQESDYIEYDIVNNYIQKRCDRRANSIYNPDNFQWGNDVVYGNSNTPDSALAIINSLASQINGNELRGGCNITITNTSTGNYSFNTIEGNVGITFINANAGGDFQDCKIDYAHLTVFHIVNIAIDLSSNQIGRFFNRNNSNFITGFDITGSTDIDFGTPFVLAGEVNISSSNPTGTVTTLTNFPDNQSVIFYPASGLTVTFDGTGGGFKNKSEDGPIAINGTKGDWIQYAKSAAGIIYETAKGKYS